MNDHEHKGEGAWCERCGQPLVGLAHYGACPRMAKLYDDSTPCHCCLPCRARCDWQALAAVDIEREAGL